MWIAALLLLLPAGRAFADNYWDEPRTTKFDQMEQVKSQIDKLIQENKVLEATYAKLQKEYAAAQMIADQSSKGKKKFSSHISPSTAPVPGQVAVSSLRGQSHALDEERRLLALRLAELQNQEQSLQLQLQMRQFSGQETAPANTSSLYNKLQQLNQKEENITHKTAQEQQIGIVGPSDVKALEYNIKRMEEQIDRIEKKVEFQKKEKQILQDKKELAQKSSEGALSEVLQEKRMYTSNLKTLEDQYNALQDKVDTALKRQARKRKLVSEIMEYDKANRVLNKKIDILTKEIDSLENQATRNDIQSAIPQ